MQIFLSIIINSLLLCILAKGMMVLYSTLRFFHIAQAISMTLGAYFVYTLLIILNLPMWGAVPVSIAVAIILMLVINRWFYRPLLSNGAKNWQLMMVSLGVYYVMQNIVSIIWGDYTLNIRTWEIKAGYEFLCAYINNTRIIIICTSIVMLLLSWLFMERTKMGKQIITISSNSELGTILGISKNKVVNWSIIYGSTMTVGAGILIAADIDMTPTMGFDWLMYGVVAMIIGGMGKMRYMFLGAFLLATAQQLSAYFFDSKWMNATAYIILVIFLYFRPFGFSGKRLKKTEV